MAAIPALVLVVFLLLRPMELWPAVAALHPLESLVTLTALFALYEAAFGKKKPAGSPQLPWLVAFVAIAFAVSVVRLGGQAGIAHARNATLLASIFMLAITFALRAERRLRAFGVTIVACTLFISGVALHQAMQPTQCVEVRVVDDDEEWTADGRACESVRQCEENGKEKVDYVCEHVGLLGTFSTGKRVRYRGQVADPNELAVLIAVMLPFLFVGELAKKRWFQIGVIPAALAVVFGAAIFTQSRGGQLAIGAVMLAYFVRRLGVRGLLVAAALAGPLVMASWREGAEAESSSTERATILYEGFDLVRAFPITGVGVGQFADEVSNHHTAHNAYLLAAAETGLVGYIAWLGLIWMSVKIPVTIALRPPAALEPTVRRFAGAVALSMLGLCVGMFFLSFTYKQVLFIILGAVGALYGYVKGQHRELEVRFERSDAIGLCVLGPTLLAIVYVLGRTSGRG